MLDKLKKLFISPYKKKQYSTKSNAIIYKYKEEVLEELSKTIVPINPNDDGYVDNKLFLSLDLHLEALATKMNYKFLSLSENEFFAKFSDTDHIVRTDIQESSEGNTQEIIKWVQSAPFLIMKDKETNKNVILVRDIFEFAVVDHSNLIQLVFDEIIVVSSNLDKIFYKNSVLNLNTEEMANDGDKMLKKILTVANSRDASDIYIALAFTSLEIRFRIDEQVEMIDKLTAKEASLLRNAIAVRASKEPTAIMYDSKVNIDNIEYRVSFFETHSGSGWKAVFRNYVKEENSLDNISNIGYEDYAQFLLRSICGNKNGIIFFTGATGTGKTISQYAMVGELMLNNLECVSVENPVEQVIRVNRGTKESPDFRYLDQVDLTATESAKDEEHKLTWESVFKKFLRSKPDFILFGEIRDEKEASLVITASTTGHLATATLHTNSVSQTFLRLKELGVDESTFKAVVRGITTQLLAPRLCDKCKVLVEEGEMETNFFKTNIYLEDSQNDEFSDVFIFPKTMKYKHYEAREGGCDECKNKGYKGKVPLPEIAEFPVYKDYDINDSKTYQNYIPIAQSAMNNYNMGHISKKHAIQASKGKRFTF